MDIKIKKFLFFCIFFLFFCFPVSAVTHRIVDDGTVINVSKNENEFNKEVSLKIFSLSDPDTYFTIKRILPHSADTLFLRNIFISSFYGIEEINSTKSYNNVYNYDRNEEPILKINDSKECKDEEIKIKTLPATNIKKIIDPYSEKEKLKCTANAYINCLSYYSNVQVNFYFTRGGYDAAGRIFGGTIMTNFSSRNFSMDFVFAYPDMQYCYRAIAYPWDNGDLGKVIYGEEVCCNAVCNNNGICELKLGETYINCINDCHCGDNVCQSQYGENDSNCFNDCPSHLKLSKFHACNINNWKCELFGEFTDIFSCQSKIENFSYKGIFFPKCYTDSDIDLTLCQTECQAPKTRYIACNIKKGICTNPFGEFADIIACIDETKKNHDYSNKCYIADTQGMSSCLQECKNSSLLPPPPPPIPLEESEPEKEKYYYCFKDINNLLCNATSQLYSNKEDCEINLTKYLKGKTTGKCYKLEADCKKECIIPTKEFYACDEEVNDCVNQGSFTSKEECKKTIGKECYAKGLENDCKKECKKYNFYFCRKDQGICSLTSKKYKSKNDCEKSLRSDEKFLNTGKCYQSKDEERDCLNDCKLQEKKVNISNLKCRVYKNGVTSERCFTKDTYDIELSADLRIDGYDAVNFWFFDEKDRLYSVGLKKYEKSKNILNATANIKNIDTGEYCFNARAQVFDNNGKLTDKFVSSPEKVCCDVDKANSFVEVDDNKKIIVNGKNYELILAKINNPEKVILDLGFANDKIHSVPVSRSEIIKRVNPIYVMGGTFYHIAKGDTFKEMFDNDPEKYWMPWRPLSNYIKNGIPHIIFNCGTSICQRYDGGFEMGRLRFNLILNNQNKAIPAINIEDNVNAEISKNGVTLYTNQWWDSKVGTELSRKYDLLSIVLDNNLRVVSVENGAQKTPNNGYVLLLSGSNKNKYKGLIKKGDKFNFIWKALPQNDVNLENWKTNCRVIFGGLHTFIYNGKLLDRKSLGDFDGCIEPEVFTYKTSRSVIGIDKEGKISLIIVKGALDTMEVGPILQKLGILRAFNIDGGCSTVAWYDKKWLGGRDIEGRWANCINPDNWYQACRPRLVVPMITYIKLK